MARYRGSVVKRARNLGDTMDGYPKSEGLKRKYPSGQHGQMRRKLSEYALQLKEKQKVRHTYGLLEKQFLTYYKKAVRRPGVTGTLLLQQLESRLDNILYRSGLVASRPQSRQVIVHSHVLVNGKKVKSPGYQLRPGDVISVKEKSQALFQTLQEGRSPIVPEWLNVDPKKMTCQLVSIPERQDMDQSVNEQLIIEYYSR